MLTTALILLAASAEPAHVNAANEVEIIEVCDLIEHPDQFDGRMVEFDGFLVADVEMMLVTGASCKDASVVISEPVQGEMKTIIPQARGAEYWLPSGVFLGRVRVERWNSFKPIIILDHGLILSSGLSLFKPVK